MNHNYIELDKNGKFLPKTTYELVELVNDSEICLRDINTIFIPKAEYIMGWHVCSMSDCCRSSCCSC